ncbi:MAG: cytochrome c biogenesis CcdA family protein [Acidimicrobiia bacterium]
MEAAELLADGGLIVALGVAFAFGALSFVSPCVLPLLPGYLSMMSGYTVAELESGEASTRKVVSTTLLFVAGFTAVFVALGAAATGFGQFLRENQLLLTRVAGFLVIAFGLVIVASAVGRSMFLQNLMRERRVDVRPNRLGAAGPAVMGVAFGFGWTPCIGPVLGAILTIAATQGSVGRGMLLLGTFSLGIGLPFLVASLGMSRLFKPLRRHLRTINIVSGALLITFGVLMVTNQVGRLSGVISEWLINIGLEDITTI